MNEAKQYKYFVKYKNICIIDSFFVNDIDCRK